MKCHRAKIIALVLLLIFAGYARRFVLDLHAESVSHVLISEIRISGESSYDEFIELYNATGAAIDLKDWDLKKTSKTGSVENIAMNIEGIIPASGYFLIVPRANCGETKIEPCYKGTVTKDAEYTTNNYLAKDNAISLYDQNGNIVDRAGWGASLEFEGEVFQNNPENGQSIERRIMGGLMQDTNNNKNDLALQASPSPQNTSTATQNHDGQGIEDQGSEPQSSQQEEQPPTSASPSSGTYAAKIIVTEFLPDPEDSDADNEFIEIYNAGSQDENIGKWIIEDRAGKIKTYLIPESIIIKTGEFKVFMSSETRIVLNNSGDGIVLKNKNSEIQDKTPISSAASEDVSYALADNGLWVWTKKPTLGSKNEIEMEEKKESPAKAAETSEKDLENKPEETINYDYSDGIIITEILPDPEGSDNKLNYEWIEIYNDSDKEVDLNGWAIDDIQNKGSKRYVLEESRKIGPQKYLIFSKEETNLILNNTEDEVNILWPDGTIVDGISYKKPKEGFSYGLFGSGEWGWSSKPSPGKENIVSEAEIVKKQTQDKMADEEENETEEGLVYGDADLENRAGKNITEFIETDVESAKKLPRFSSVKVSGIVSVSPGIFQDNMFYISGSGMQIFSYSKIFGGIKLGDKVELFGKMSEIGGEKRLLVESPDLLKIINHDNLLEPKMISTGEIGEKYEGYLVLVEGKVAEVSGSMFYVDDDSGKAKVYIKSGTKIKKPAVSAGDMVNVTGVVSRTSLGYRLLPRFQNDIKIGKTSGIFTEESGSEITGDNKRENGGIPLYYYGFAMAAIVVLIDWGRMRAKK